MSVEYGSNITPLFGDREPPEPPAAGRPRVKKRRLLAILLPLGAAGRRLDGLRDDDGRRLRPARPREPQGVPGRAQLGPRRRPGPAARRPDQQPEPRARRATRTSRRTCATRSSRSRTGASTRTRASTCAASAARSCRTCSAARRRRAARPSPSSSSRTRCGRSPTAPCSRRCARRRWPTTSRASGRRARSSREYLNSIYFGNGAYGVESAARTYFGNQPDHKDCGTRDEPVRQGAQARRGRAASPASSPTRRPTTPSPTPQAALARRNLVLKDMFDQGLLPLREYRDARIQALPASDRHQAARPCGPRRRTSRPGCASSSSTGSAPARAFEGGLKVKTTLDLELQDAAEQAVNKYLANPAGPSAAARGDRQQDRRGARDGRRARLRHAPVQPRHAGPAPARLVDQAVHPRRGAEEGHTAPGSLWPSRKRVFTVPGTTRQARSSSSTTSRASTRARRRSPAA